MTNRRKLLKTTLTTNDYDITMTYGVACDFNSLNGITILTTDKQIRYYLWVTNPEFSANQFVLKGCASASTCSDISISNHFTILIGLGKIYNQYEFKMETIDITKSTTAGVANISLNGGPSVAVYLDASNKLWLKMLFKNDPFILKLSYLQANVIDSPTQRLYLPSPNICSSTSQCFPGYVCSNDNCANSIK